MEIKKGDKVRFTPDLPLGVGLERQGQVGTVTEVYEQLPGQAHPRVDIEFPDGVERGISVHQIEHA